MADNSKESSQNADQAQIQQLRDILLGKDKAQIKQVLRDNAREVVGDVVIEAIHDRQQKDGSLNTVMVPIVEKSVEKSVKNHSEQFVGYLYPLVGRLVRKSVTAFLSEFLEKTNELIENSLTAKGVIWRFRAWQAGVSFSQYVASQTFVFRVEQVLLIHKETGVLLNSVSRANNDSNDADLVSSMLTAINDFVSDSFNPGHRDNEQNLEVIKTEDFSLVIKQGPQLVLVAAITGNIPQDISTKFQVANEYIHNLYAKEINEFQGETLPFEATSKELQECLLAELRPEAEKAKKKPIWGILVLLIAVGFIVYWLYLSYQQNRVLANVSRIGEEPGIIVHDTSTQGFRSVSLSILRDPDAITVEKWLADNNIDASQINISQKRYLSLEPSLVKARVMDAMTQYSSVDIEWQNASPILSGVLPNAQRQLLARQLQAIPGLTQSPEMLKGIESKELNTAADDSPEILNALFEINSAKIDSTEIEFDQGQSQLNETSKDQLLALASYMKSVIELSKKLELNVGLIIMGASDASGSRQYNQSLSRKRAQAAQQFLVDQGIDEAYLNAIGLGVIELKSTGSGARKVIFNIIDFKTE